MANPAFDVIVVGEALNDFGFEAYDTISGIGLNTFGFLWDGDGFWAPCCDTPTNVWMSCDSGISTSWSNADPSVVTIWTSGDFQGGP